MKTTIHIKLLDEGVECWRPVMAEQITDREFKILSQRIPSDEHWEFKPGDIVVVEKIELSGEFCLTAVMLSNKCNKK